MASGLFDHSAIVPVEKSSLQLGAWQRVLRVEGDGPRARKV
ncbi:YjbQ family protein [Candidatus Micrarchaeota archaeon]|nr:YjbQ family protein [Candidatus Micrarchaeota archaeon]